MDASSRRHPFLIKKRMPKSSASYVSARTESKRVFRSARLGVVHSSGVNHPNLRSADCWRRMKGSRYESRKTDLCNRCSCDACSVHWTTSKTHHRCSQGTGPTHPRHESVNVGNADVAQGIEVIRLSALLPKSAFRIASDRLIQNFFCFSALPVT